MFACCISKDEQQDLIPPPPAAGDRVTLEGQAEKSDAEKSKVFSFTVQKTGGKDLLGMDVKHKKGLYLVVSKIFDDGAVKRANGMVPEDERLQETDIILEINGVKGDDNAMVEECKKSSRLEMQIKRILPS
ncbi:unnamed protein product [Effrenium voratum]|nr:unnamed protein product [Effrenium voratum]